MRLLREPDAAAALSFLRHEFAAMRAGHGRLVQLLGAMTVKYSGRAASDLDAGERLVLFKPDGALLIHGATRVKPVNWQPPGSAFEAGTEEGRLVVLASRRSPAETVLVEVERVDLLLAVSLADTADLVLRGSEEQIAAALQHHPEALEPGLRVLAREREWRRGPMDLYAEDARGRRVVVEVKRTVAGIGEATQLWRYVEHERQARRAPVRGLLAAPAASEAAKRMLAEHGLEFVRLDWSRLLPLIESPRSRSQSSLARFGEGA